MAGRPGRGQAPPRAAPRETDRGNRTGCRPAGSRPMPTGPPPASAAVPAPKLRSSARGHRQAHPDRHPAAAAPGSPPPSQRPTPVPNPRREAVWEAVALFPATMSLLIVVTVEYQPRPVAGPLSVRLANRHQLLTPSESSSLRQGRVPQRGRRSAERSQSRKPGSP